MGKPLREVRKTYNVKGLPVNRKRMEAKAAGQNRNGEDVHCI